MAIDRTKVRDTAQKYLAKGQFDKAIVEYQKLVREDPTDVRTWLQIGDLYTRKGARKEAADTYTRVANMYGEQGFFQKAAAVYKQILKLDPTLLDIQLRLAEMYEQLGLVSESIMAYEQVAGAYERNGESNRALSTIGRMVELDPNSIPVRIKFAEALSKAERAVEAAAEFEAGCKLLREQGRIDDYIKVAERLLYHRPDDVGAARELARIYLERGDAKRALAKLQVCFKADPRDIATLDLLAAAFSNVGQVAKTISVYREIAKIHQDANRPDDRARALQRILSLDPQDAEARTALASFAPPPMGAAPPPPRVDTGMRQAPPPTRMGPPPKAPPPLVGAPEVGAPEPGPRTPMHGVRMRAAVEEQVVRRGNDSRTSQIPELEAEEVLEDSDLLQSVPPDEVSEQAPIARAREKETRSGEVRTERHDAAMLGELAARTSRQQEREPATAPSGLVQLPSEAPPAARAKRPSSFPPTASSVPPEIAREAQIARLLTETEVFLRYGLRAKVIDHLRTVLRIDPNHLEARERLKDAFIEAGRIPEAIAELHVLATMFADSQPEVSSGYLQRILELDPKDAAAHEALAGLPTGRASDDGVFFLDEEHRSSSPNIAIGAPSSHALDPMSPEEFEAAPVSPAPARASLRPSGMSIPIEDILDEVDFFLTQGLYDDARASLQEALSAYPQNPLLRDKLAEVEDAAAAAAEFGAPDGSLDDASFQLAEKLAEELGPSPPDAGAGGDTLDVEQVFAQFKAGVAKQVGAEDTETHFELGIAYKEMGLLDDAISEFKLAMANPERECTSLMMMGLCCIEKGNFADAVAHLKKGLYSQKKTDREELGLYFELGIAYELLADKKEALYYFRKVQKREPGFREVENRIAALEGNATAAEETPHSIEDVDRAFDDLMNDK